MLIGQRILAALVSASTAYEINQVIKGLGVCIPITLETSIYESFPKATTPT